MIGFNELKRQNTCLLSKFSIPIMSHCEKVYLFDNSVNGNKKLQIPIKYVSDMHLTT